MTYSRLMGLLVLLIALPAAGADLRHPSSFNSFCVTPDQEHLCPEFPNDQTDFSDKFVYMLINVETQNRFDVFSWQAFVALNWPALGRAPLPRDESWDTFRRREQIFGTDIAREACGEAEVITASIAQADGSVLIDQDGNFIVYEVRVNPTAEAYILDNALHTLAGQEAFGDKPVSFPQGSVGINGSPASVLLKTAWQVLPAGPRDDYITRDGVIFVPADRTVAGTDLCVRETLGLVGMHIVARTQSGNGDEWLWTTFEHRATAPTAGNTREINAIYSRDLFPGGCTAPAGTARTEYILFDPACPDCPTNQSPEGDWTWADAAPYARLDGRAGVAPPQVTRCWDVFEGTRELNDLWQAELAGTPLAHYDLISTQWRGADLSPMFEHGEVPRYLTNTTMETFLQADKDGTCLGCHAGAETAAGQDANFTFLLRDAQ